MPEVTLSRKPRTFTIHVCSLCGSDEIEEATEDNARCGSCGEWMNTVPLEVREVVAGAEGTR